MRSIGAYFFWQLETSNQLQVSCKHSKLLARNNSVRVFRTFRTAVCEIVVLFQSNHPFSLYLVKLASIMSS